MSTEQRFMCCEHCMHPTSWGCNNHPHACVWGESEECVQGSRLTPEGEK